MTSEGNPARVNSLVTWINTFDAEVLGSPVNALTDLHDGVALFEILAKIAPKHFDTGDVKRDAGDNWVIKSNNLKKLVARLAVYYAEALGAPDIDFGSLFNVTQIARDHNAAELALLVEYVLGAAVQCHDKEEYIQRVIQLDPTTQQHLMQAIEKVMSVTMSHNENDHVDAEAAPHAGAGSGPSRSPRDRLDTSELEGDRTSLSKDELIHQLEEHDEAFRRHEALAQAHEELKRAHALSEERMGLIEQELQTTKAERDRVSEHLAATDRRLKDEKEVNERMQREQQGRATELDFVKERAEAVEQELGESKRRLAEASRLQQANRNLQDELDAARSKAAEVERVEATLSKYKKRVDELAEVKRSLRNAEDKCNEYAEKVLDLEDQVAKQSQMKLQIDQYKDKVLELERTTHERTIENEAKDSEIIQLRADLSTAQQNASAVSAELKSLQTQYDVLMNGTTTDEEAALLQTPGARSDGEAVRAPGSTRRGAGGGGAVLAAELATPATRQRIARLERTNRELRARLGEQGDEATQGQISMLENMIDDAVRLKNQFQQDYATARQDVLRLQNENETLKAQIESVEQSAGRTTGLESENSILTDRLATANRELAQLKQRMAATEKAHEELRQKEIYASRALTQAKNDLVTAKTELSLVSTEQRDQATSAVKDIEDRIGSEKLQLQADLAQTATQLSEAEEKLKEVQSDRETLLAQMEELRTENKQYLSELHAAMKERGVLSSSLISNREQALEREREFTALQAQLAAQDVELGRLRNELEAASTKPPPVPAADGKASVSSAELEVLQLKLERAETLYREARARVEQVTAEKSKLAEDRARLEAYLQQAKLLLTEYKTKAAKAHQRELSAVEERFGEAIAALQTQLAEQEKEIQFLKKARDDAGAAQRREEHLMMSAFYSLGQELHTLRAKANRGMALGRSPGDALSTPMRGQGSLSALRSPLTPPTPSSWLGSVRKKL